MAEIDLFMIKDGKRIEIDFKYVDALQKSKTMDRIVNDLSLDKVKMIYSGDQRYFIQEKIEVMGLKSFITDQK